MKKFLLAAVTLLFGLSASAQSLQMKKNLLEGDNSTFNEGWGNWEEQGDYVNRSLEATDGPDGSQCAKLSNSDNIDDYKAQLKYNYSATNNTTYVFRLKAKKVTGSGRIKVILQHNDPEWEQQQFFQVNVTDSWVTYEAKITANRGDYNVLMINYGNCGEVLIDDIEFGIEGTPEGPSIDPDVYPEGNLLSQDQWGFEKGIDKWYSWNNNPKLNVVESDYQSGHCLEAKVSDTGGNEWGAQVMLNLDSTPEVGGVYTVSFRAKAKETANISFVMSRHEAPHLTDGISINPISLTTEWAHFTGDVTINNAGEDRLTFNVGKVATDYYIDNVSVVLKEAPVHATGVSLDKNVAEVGVGSTITLVATVAPAEATIQKVTWESDATDIATVDENGVVTGVAEGTANITVTTVDGSFKATCAVTVETLSWTAVANGSAIKYAWDEETKTIYLRGEGAMPTNKQAHEFAYYGKRLDVVNVVIGEGITTVGNNAFDVYENIESVQFPSTLTALGDQAFKQCHKFVNYDFSNTKITSISTDAFKWSNGSNKTWKLPATLQSIEKFNDNNFQNATYEFHSIPAFTNALNNPASVSIILDDAEHPFIADATTNMPTIAQAKYKRNVTATYSTICLPFNAAIPGGVTVYEMIDASDESITLTAAQSIVAGTPYVVATANLDITGDATTISVATTDVVKGSMKFIGVMQKKELNAEAHAYGLYEGQLHLNTGTMTVNPMRAYFESTGSPAREMSLLFGGEVTSINNVAAASDIVEVYNVNGARQPGLAKGINLVKTANGNIVKVIVK